MRQRYDYLVLGIDSAPRSLCTRTRVDSGAATDRRLTPRPRHARYVGADVDACTHQGRSAFAMACYYCSPELIHYLAATHHCDINKEDADDRSPMAWAAIAERPEVMIQIVLLGAHIHFYDFHYLTQPGDGR